MNYGLREANQRFARLIRDVRAGREVVLTERGRPLAVIRPIAGGADEQARLDAMAAAGLVTRAAEPGPMPAPRWKPVRATGASISDTVARDRDESA